MAAVLACGDGAALSHESAAALWGIRKGGRHPIDVSTPATRHARLEAIQAHRRNPMPETTTVNSIPVTQPLFTLVDLAASLKTRPLEAAINEADKLGLVDPEDAPGVLDAIGRVAGKAKLRRALTRHTRTDSDLERRFLRLVERARLPKPQTQAEVSGYRVDFYWPNLGLVVETDGITYHRTPTQQIRDRERDQAHARAGLASLRFANLQIRDDPATVMATLTAVSARLRNTPPGGGH
jgi:very-short-patch-repair endonuclease